MAILMTCTGCDAALKLADTLRGKKVRCKKCGESLTVPAEGEDDIDAEPVQEEPKLKVKPKKAAKDADDDSDDEPAKKKKKKKKAKNGSSGILIAAGIAGVVLLLVGGGVSAVYFFRATDQKIREGQQAKAKTEEDKPGFRIAPTIAEGSPTKQGGKGIVNNVRGAVYRTERRSELANINKMFTAWVLETPKAQQNRASFLAYIHRDFRPGHEAISEGYYRLNLKAQSGTADILAGERDEDQQGNLVVRCNGSIDYVPAAEFKKAMGL